MTSRWSVRRGFSLAEACICVGILGALAALVAPAMSAAMRSAREGRAIANVRSLAGAQMTAYAAAGRFRVVGELFESGALARDAFRLASEGGKTRQGGAAEVLSDGVYEYSFRFSDDGAGVTLDADPAPRFRSTYRRFRARLGRALDARAGGAESIVLVAAPSDDSPPPTAYRALGR